VLADHVRRQRALLVRGYLIVGEFNDHPDHFADLVGTNYFALRSCHCLQTTTEVMAEALRTFNPYVVVFLNRIRQCSSSDRSLKSNYGSAHRRSQDFERAYADQQAASRRVGATHKISNM
jgi:hypothetical protein